MPKKPLPECPITKLPTLREVFWKIHRETSEIDDPYRKALLFLELWDTLIARDDDLQDFCLKYRIGFLEEVIGYADAVTDPEQRTDIHRDIIDSLCAHSYGHDRDAIAELIEEFDIPEIKEWALVRELGALQHESSVDTQDEHAFQEAFSRITPGSRAHAWAMAHHAEWKARTGDWDAAVDETRQIKDDLLRARTLIEIARRHAKKRPGFAEKRNVWAGEIKSILLPHLKDHADESSVIVHFTHLVEIYAGLGLFDDALEILESLPYSTSMDLCLKQTMMHMAETRSPGLIADRIRFMAETVRKSKSAEERRAVSVPRTTY